MADFQGDRYKSLVRAHGLILNLGKGTPKHYSTPNL